MWARSLGQEDPLKWKMGTHYSILAWKMPWTEEPCGLQSMGSQSQTQLRTHALHFQASKHDTAHLQVFARLFFLCSPFSLE